MEEKYIAAIEIGSSHIRAAVGTVDDTGALTLLAVEEDSCRCRTLRHRSECG